MAVEKSLEDFLKLPLPGTKVVVGDGPSREELQRAYPDVVWRGYQFGAELSAHFASADCFVFPSRTETFGNVILEALASGLPVASVPAPGPGRPGHRRRERRHRRRSPRRLPARDHLLARRARASVVRRTLRAGHDLFRAHLVPLRPEIPFAAPAPAPQAEGVPDARLLAGQPSSGCPILMTAPWLMPSHSREPVRREHDDGRPQLEPTHLLPLAKRRVAGTARGPSYARCNGTSRKRSRMLATRIDATGTRVTT